MTVAVCPDQSILQQLLLGQLDAGEASALDQHLLACERCCAVLHELEANDTLADAVRAVTAEAPPLDERVEAVMAHLKEATLPGKAMEETLARSVEPTGDAWELEKFLDPPEAEGELGRFGGYRVLRVLGAGGMGLVLEGEDPKLRRRVALKVMKSSLAARDEHHQRFLREARAAAAIEHPHIVTVHQVGEHRGLPFMAMQLLKGEALDERLRRQPALSLAECLRIGRETAEALAEAHGRNLIHRDIKPGNIWLEGTSGWVKLVDFGLAHAAEDVHLTQTGAIMGTPAYMSPEQARGETVDGRSDLYSLGAVLYKLTTGDVPFRGASTMAVLMALATEAPRPPSELNAEVPPALNDLILRLLAKMPDERFDSAEAVAEAIREIEAERASPKPEVQSPKPGDGVGRRRPRWQLVAAAAAACFVLAAIVIVVRDKHGKEVFRGTVRDGGSVTVTDDGATANRPTAAVKATPADLALPIKLPEPPPLEEWLKGREVLTVAQDGSGQFKTIQAALDALQSGEVVSVLDRGPYRERLVVDRLPSDTGLISKQGAVVELSEWKLTGKDERGDWHQGHVLSDIDGFRLHGFDFVFPEDIKQGDRFHVFRIGGLVIEQCRFRDLPNETWDGHPLWLQDQDVDGRPHSVWVRHCTLEGYLEIVANGKNEVTAVIEQNEFDSIHCDHHIHLHGDAWKRVVVRHNVFHGKAAYDVSVKQAWKPSATFEVTNNTSTTVHDLVVFQGSAEHGNVTIRNNVRTSPRLIGALKGADLDLVAAQRNWRVEHNIYPAASPAQPWMSENVAPRSPADVPATPRFLSKNPADTDYLRIAADGPLATAGAGGDWPSYVGALAPGPAPSSGDWFSRLRAQWRAKQRTTGNAESAEIPPPVTLSEPPPLEEWLKGRTVLTVAQDGSGQFKTIQAALDALKPHQVVKVLDRGPYREFLEGSGGLPPDTGLISEQQATIEVPTWDDGQGAERDNAHHMGPVDGFRVSGLRFIAPPRKSWGGILIWWRVSGVVVEDCYFGWTAPSESKTPFAALSFFGETNSTPITVRNCFLDSAALYLASVPTFLIEQNYFHHTIVGFENRIRHARVRHNLFVGEGDVAIDIKHVTDVEEVVEISNNTLLGSTCNVREGAPERGVVIRNNTFSRGIGLDNEADELRGEIIQGWQVDHNNYLRFGSLPQAPGDILADPNFLSSEPSHREYARIPAGGPLATGGVGGQLPNHIGALPPGPAAKEGDWFTRLRERWGVTAPKDASAIATNMPPPLQVPEPPPLDEWLKGREVLTVAQDGSGQFKTIQAALNALQAGQVVKVLDAGPYRERLDLDDVPADSGLVSEKGTVLELPDYALHYKDADREHYKGHFFRNMDGFRMAGFALVLPAPLNDDSPGLLTHRHGGLVLERCWIQGPGHTIIGGHAGGSTKPICIRECRVDGSLLLGFENESAVTLLTRNLFFGTNFAVAIHEGSFYKYVGIHNNVFAGPDPGLIVTARKRFERVEISNNTFLCGSPVLLNLYGPPGTVVVCNNLRLRAGLLAVSEGAEKQRDAVLRNLYVGHNCYPRELAPEEGWPTEQLVPKSPDDTLATPRLVSKVAGERDYLRLVADDPIAQAGAGGDWPSYIGALPPGPAPTEGDFFTRLQKQQRAAEQETATARPVDIPPPMDVPEPPPLEEWLKDREVLTVAQDGSGQFKTIQAALDALQAGQVVKVLDAGPYREQLNVNLLPADTGLVSEVGTSIESPGYRVVNQGSPWEVEVGHCLRDMDGFRLAGFKLVFAAPVGEGRCGLHTFRCGGFVLERCWLQGTIKSVVAGNAGDGGKPACVRECLIEGVLDVGSLANDQATGLVTRNLFFGPIAMAMIDRGSVYRYVGIKGNVFAGPREGVAIHAPTHLGRLEVANNTFLGNNPIVGYDFDVDSIPKGEAIVCNNLRLRPGLLALVASLTALTPEASAQQRDAVRRTWQVAHNCYPRKPGPGDWAYDQSVAKFPQDLMQTPRLLSMVAEDRDYLRPAALDPTASAGAGGDWPAYIGALLPGPAPNGGDWFTRLRERWGIAVPQPATPKATGVAPPTE